MRIGLVLAALAIGCVLGLSVSAAVESDKAARGETGQQATRAAAVDLLAIDPAAISAVIQQAMEERDVAGASVGIVAGDRLLYSRAFGRLNDGGDPALVDSLYQIGSITKTFTATLLCALRDEGLLRLDDPAARYLPDLILPTDPAGAPEITLRHLATHTSGLPSNPVNRRDVPRSPSVMLPYSIDELHAGLRDTRLDLPVGAAVRYSNLGYGLLGHLLERAAGADLESLILGRVTGPLGMADTRITLSPDDERRLAAHYWPDGPDTAQPRWRFGEVSGFGGLTSSVPDLARYVSFQLGALAVEPSPISLATVREMQTPQRLADQRWKRAIGLGWLIEPTDEHGPLVYHGGELDGHSSFVGFLPDHGVGVIVLANKGGNAAELLSTKLVKEVLAAVRAELDTVDAFFDDGQWASALPLVRVLAQRSPQVGHAAFRLGTVLLEVDRARPRVEEAGAGHADPDPLDEARAAFETSQRLGFNRPESAFGIARCLARAGSHDAALDALAQAYRAGFRDGQVGATSSDFDALHGDPRFRALVTERFPGIGPLFLDVIDGGATAALANHRLADLGEAAVNQLGYQLLFRGRVDDAIEVFRSNVAAYPGSWNVYDSLGEAYMNAGQVELAIRNYERSIELNPRNTNGMQMLERIRAVAEDAP